MHIPDINYIAALPIYDFDELAGAHACLWAALAARLAASGLMGS